MTAAADGQGDRLSEAERNALDDSLMDSGCHGFQGDHPDLYAAVERILRDRARPAAEDGLRADAWDEGYDARGRDIANEGLTEKTLTPNPRGHPMSDLRAAIEALARYTITGTEWAHGVTTTRTRDYVLWADLRAVLAAHPEHRRTSDWRVVSCTCGWSAPGEDYTAFDRHAAHPEPTTPTAEELHPNDPTGC